VLVAVIVIMGTGSGCYRNRVAQSAAPVCTVTVTRARSKLAQHANIKGPYRMLGSAGPNCTSVTRADFR
jgi:hypothetical protein